MINRLACAALLMSAALAISGCGSESLEDISPKAERPLPAAITQVMTAKGMSKGAPIMMRIFKEEGVLEVWKQKQSGRYDLVKSYEICKWSGKLGPKFTEGDRQAPEGFYSIGPHQMNPRSSYHLAFNIGFPNTYDQANGRTGQHLMVHGACSSSGCYSMTDEQVEEIYAFARDAFRGGQQAFQLQAYPFRMTAENMARYRGDPNYQFWTMLKEGYDHFEVAKAPPRVDVCERRYVFNRIPAEGAAFEPLAACPPSMQPPALLTAYQAYKKKQDIAFAKALTKKKDERKPSIVGPQEAQLVADWSRRRARGEKVTAEPPSLAPVMVAETAEPMSSPAPVTAYTIAAVPRAPAAAASTTGSVSQAQTEVGAPPIAASSLPLPTPNPSQAAAPEAEPAPAAEPKRRRIWNPFGG